MKKVKRCCCKIGCGKIKEVGEFHPANKKTGRLSDQCKECRSKIRRNETIAKHKQYNEKNGITGGKDKCYVCGEIKEIRFFKLRANTKLGYERICKVCHNLKNKTKYHNNLEISREKRRKYSNKYRKNPENRKKDNLCTKKFFEEHPYYRREYEKYRRETDILFRLKKNMSRRIRSAIRNKSKLTIEYLGCSMGELIVHLEKQFYSHPKSGEIMTWKNYGFSGWHIDHIIPLASANNELDMVKLFHYTNLQPLWAKENLSKGAKIIGSKQ